MGLSVEEQIQIFNSLADSNFAALSTLKFKDTKLGSILASVLNLKGNSSSVLKNMKAMYSGIIPEFTIQLDDFIKTTELLEEMGYRFQIDVTSGKGLEYYTGIVFQFNLSGEVIGGGGRYDNLIPLMGGGNVPASGFALYLDHLMPLVNTASSNTSQSTHILIRTDAEVIKEGFAVAKRLREAGFIAELNLGQPKMSDFRLGAGRRAKPEIFALRPQPSPQVRIAE